MDTRFSVLVALESWQIGARMRDRFGALPGVDVIGQACTPDDVLKMNAREKPDLVVLDVVLSGGIGLGVLRSLKAPSSRPIVIATTTSGFQQYRREMMKEGADYFFRLPDEFVALCRTVSTLAKVKVAAGNSAGHVEEQKKSTLE